MKKLILCLILSLLTLLGTGFVLSGCKDNVTPPPEETVPEEPPKGGLVNGGVYIAH